MKQITIEKLDFKCRINNRNIIYNRSKQLCGFGNDGYYVSGN